MDRRTINLIWSDDGGLIVEWMIPDEAKNLNPDEWFVELTINADQGAKWTCRYYRGRGPLMLGYTTVSNDMLEKLNSIGTVLWGAVQIWKKDYSNRSISDRFLIWAEP